MCLSDGSIDSRALFTSTSNFTGSFPFKIHTARKNLLKLSCIFLIINMYSILVHVQLICILFSLVNLF